MLAAALRHGRRQFRVSQSNKKDHYSAEGETESRSDNTAFFLLGELVEYNTTEKLFSIPSDKRTEDYITGRFG